MCKCLIIASAYEQLCDDGPTRYDLTGFEESPYFGLEFLPSARSKIADPY